MSRGNLGSKSLKNWRKVKLGEIAGEIRELYEPVSNEHMKYIGLEHINPNTLQLLDIGDSSDTQSTKKVFSENDILFGTLRAYFRKVVKPKFNGVCSTDITVLRSKWGCDQNFLYYFIANPRFINFAASSAEGTRMPRASWRFLANTKWYVPPLNEQKHIASILSAFDEKIELNNKINQTLEKMAQAIFKGWFVNFRFPGWEKVKFVDSELGLPAEASAQAGKIPGGWKVGLIKDLGKVVTGKTPSTEIKENFGSEFPFVTIPDMNEVFIIKTERYLSERGLEKMKNMLLPAGSICVSCIATVGLVGITTQQSLTNQQINSIIPDKEELTYFLYLYFRNKKKDLELFGSGGTATLIINKTKFENLDLIIPNERILKDFHSTVKPMYEKTLCITRENQKLAGLRDLLLPKLMRGEIRI